MTSYVEYVNGKLKARMAREERLIAYGQNITAGSHLSGLTRGISAGTGSRIINTPNVENTLVGLGFGVMLRGLSALFLCKQQDFLLLGMDHIVNTYNAIRHRPGLGSFTIVAIVVDSGFEGPQSALHNLTDICSIAQVPGYLIAGSHDADTIIERHLIRPGFRIIGVSQRLFRTPIDFWAEGEVTSDPDGDVFQYASGEDATVVAFNLSLPQAKETWREIRKHGATADLFSVNNVWGPDLAAIHLSLERTGRLVVFDDGKSANRQSDRFLSEALLRCRPQAVVRVQREFSLDWYKPNPDQLEIDAPAIVKALGLAQRRATAPAEGEAAYVGAK